MPASSANAVPPLVGRRVLLRPGGPEDVGALEQILHEPAVRRWWGHPDAADTLRARLGGSDGVTVLVIVVGGAVAGAIQFDEEEDPDYRHAGIDLFLGTHFQGIGLGREAIEALACHLIDVRGHHRLTIDPGHDNARAIAAYQRVGFRPVGVLRRHERRQDGQWHDGLLLDLLADELVRTPSGRSRG
ncbi:MAG: GNAT family N-acetyltransferase [Actinomycetota bacterium]|nr:GNAT family N-acetyltransferase [Actinomycetota bacterium]